MTRKWLCPQSSPRAANEGGNYLCTEEHSRPEHWGDFILVSRCFIPSPFCTKNWGTIRAMTISVPWGVPVAALLLFLWGFAELAPNKHQGAKVAPAFSCAHHLLLVILDHSQTVTALPLKQAGQGCARFSSHRLSCAAQCGWGLLSIPPLFKWIWWGITGVVAFC